MDRDHDDGKDRAPEQDQGLQDVGEHDRAQTTHRRVRDRDRAEREA